MVSMEYFDIFKASEVKYDNQTVKLIAVKDIPEIELAGETIGPIDENSYIEVKNWIADKFIENGLAKFASEEERLNIINLQKSQVKENMQSPRRFSTLPENFYPKLRKFLRRLKERTESDPMKIYELQKANKLAADIVSSRLSKILILSSAHEEDENLLKNLSPEERVLYDKLHQTVNMWRELAFKY